jgi:Ti-type conjugative transfer relaxase TraA
MHRTGACLAKYLPKNTILSFNMFEDLKKEINLKMAIDFARAEFVKRSNGQNACQKSAYIDRDRVIFEGTKFQERRIYDFSNREEPIAKKILLPNGVNKKFKNPEILWNQAEQAEPQHNSQVAIELVIALPDDKIITDKDRLILTERFAQQFADKELAAHYAIHQPDDGTEHNWHAHILIPTRTFSRDGETLSPLKDRSLIKELSNTRWGEKWKELQNTYFKELGLSLRVDEKALIPEKHLGPVRLRKNCIEMLQQHQELKTLNALEAGDPAKILASLENTKSVWQEHDVERFMAKHTPLEKIDEVREQFWQQEEIIKLQIKSDNRYSSDKDLGKFTTLKVIEEEKQILRRAQKVLDVTHAKIKPECKATKFLNNPQHEAFKKLSTRESLAILEGYAGTGKSYVLTALKEAYEAKGVTVRGFGPDNATANLLKDKGFSYAENVPKFLYAEHHGYREIQNKELWIVDEAGKLGNESLNELLRLAHVNKAKLVLAGDIEQMPSVERGGMFQVLAEKCRSAKLLDIQRQATQEQREMVQKFAEGNIKEAVQDLGKADGLIFGKDKVESIEKLILDWSFSHYKNPEKGYDTSLILASTNREVNVLNQAAHDIRLFKGEISKEEYHCTTAFGSVRVSAGDLIELRKNDRDIGATNGMKGKLIDAKEDRFTIEIEDQNKNDKKVSKIVSFNPKEYGSWQLGYATTTFRAQGRTVEEAYVLHSANNSKQTAYVAMSRHQDKVKCYISDKECGNWNTLAEQLSKDSSKETTVYYDNEHDIAQAKAREAFEAKISDDKEWGGKWGKLCAHGRELKQNIRDFVDHYKEKSLDKRDSNAFYEREISDAQDQTFGALKLPDLEISKNITNEASIAIGKDIINTVEKEAEQQLLLERQQIQMQKLFTYQEKCLFNGNEQIHGAERMFTPDHERSVVVFCASQEQAKKAAENFKQKDYVFVASGNEHQKDIDFSILEGRKILVWGEEQDKLCDKLKNYENMHVRTTDHDFVRDDANRMGWMIEQKAHKEIGSWEKIDEKNLELDKHFGLENERDHGIELSLF